MNADTPRAGRPATAAGPAAGLRGRLAYYAGLYALYLRLFAKTRLQYRADLGVMTAAMVVSEGGQLLFIAVIFGNVRALDGWAYHEVLLMYALRVLSGGLTVGLLNMPWTLQAAVRLGELDATLIRPPAPLAQLIGRECLTPWAFGRLAVGAAALALALRGLGAQAQPWWALYLALVVVGGAVLGFSIMLIVACLAFWFTSVQSVLYPVGWFSLFAEFPLTLYASPLRFALTWVLPYGMASFYPAAFLLRGAEYRAYGLLAPALGWLFLGLALGIWRVALRRYGGTGS